MAQADLGVHMTLGAHGGYPLARSQLQGLAGALADVVLGERSAPPFHALVQSADRRICFWATRMLPGVHQGGIQVKVAFYKAWYEQPAMEIDLSVSFIVQARATVDNDTTIYGQIDLPDRFYGRIPQQEVDHRVPQFTQKSSFLVQQAMRLLQPQSNCGWNGNCAAVSHRNLRSEERRVGKECR